jgi:hypothetical protein
VIKNTTITITLRFVLLALLLQFAFPVLAGNDTTNGGDALHHELLIKHDVKPVALGLFEKTENEEENRDEDISTKNSSFLSFVFPIKHFERTTLRYTKKSGHIIEWPVYLKFLVFRI